MRITTMSLFVDDQQKAFEFYTEKLGFLPKADIPLGEYRWLTLVSPEAPDGTELLLEPKDHTAARAFTSAITADGIPFTSFGVDDVVGEHARLEALGVRFTQPPIDMGTVTTAIFDDSCGNLIQIASRAAS